MHAYRPHEEPIEATIDPHPVTPSGVVVLRLVGVADLSRLCSGEVARLRYGKLEYRSMEVLAVRWHLSSTET